MLALPVSRHALSIAKFCVLVFYLFMEMVVFLAVFVAAGQLATHAMGITETLPVLYLLRRCALLFLTMLPCVAIVWAITVLFEKPLLCVGVNLLPSRFYSGILQYGVFTVSVPALCGIDVWLGIRAGSHTIWQKRNEVKKFNYSFP